jgi:hypothetical protein
MTSQIIEPNSLSSEPVQEPVHHAKTGAITKAGQIEGDLGALIRGGHRRDEGAPFPILQHKASPPLAIFLPIQPLLCEPLAPGHGHNRLRHAERSGLGEAPGGLIQEPFE